jgi:predicted amidohydrolase YtcJ
LFDLLRKRNQLTLRVYQALTADATLTEAGLDQLEEVRTRFADDPVLKAGAIKLFADGVIESHTAAMLAPYANRPSTRGEARFTPEQLNKVVGMLDGRGWQIMTHAIGDAAVRMTLDAYQAAAKSNAAPERGRRHRLEHIETIDPQDIPRFGRLGVVASMQPVHATTATGNVWSTNIGEERASHGWLWASIAKTRGPIAFGSDWPVATFDPKVGLHIAVTRTTPVRSADLSAEAKAEALASASAKASADQASERRGGAERLPIRQAIQAYTRDGAWASFDEQRKGTLARDMLADIVVLSEDIFTGPPARLLETEVMVTIVDGKVVYRRDPPETTTAQ